MPFLVQVKKELAPESDAPDVGVVRVGELPLSGINVTVTISA